MLASLLHGLKQILPTRDLHVFMPLCKVQLPGGNLGTSWNNCFKFSCESSAQIAHIERNLIVMTHGYKKRQNYKAVVGSYGTKEESAEKPSSGGSYPMFLYVQISLKLAKPLVQLQVDPDLEFWVSQRVRIK